MPATKPHTILLTETKELEPSRESDTFGVNFGRRLASGVTLASDPVVVEVDSNGDVSPVALSISDVEISGNVVQATIARGAAAPGTTRYVLFAATKSDGKTVANIGRIYCTSYAGK